MVARRIHRTAAAQLLKDNLYEFQRYLRNAGMEPYFTVPRLQRVARECLEALMYMHGLGVIHCDFKPENVLIKSYSRFVVSPSPVRGACGTCSSI